MVKRFRGSARSPSDSTSATGRQPGVVAQRRQRRGIAVVAEVGGHHRRQGVALEQAAPDQQLVGQAAERVDVGRRRLGARAHPLGTHTSGAP